MSSRSKTAKSHSSVAASHGQNVKVAVRCRPMNAREKKQRCKAVTQVEPRRKEVAMMLDDVKMASYNFDCVFDDSATQQQVYQSVVADVVDEALKGFNCTVFAYGQTGTGKTYTMEGNREVSARGTSAFWFGANAGMIPRATQQIFQRLEARYTRYTVETSYLELYNEDLIDLLNPDVASESLSLCHDENRNVVVPGLRKVKVANPDELFNILDVASKKRHTAETLLNDRSSRSHCIFTVTITTVETLPNGEDITHVGKLNLVDLAGSENTKKSGAGKKKETMKQAVMINTSLLALGRVITKLTSGSGSHIPYRDSKLTRLLQESLGGKAKTCLIATISPSEDCLDETKSTLEYAFRAKDIKNRPLVSTQLTKKAEKKDYMHVIDTLKRELSAARAKDGVHIDETHWEETQAELANANAQVEEMTRAIEARDAHLEQLQGQFDNTSKDLDLSIQRYKHTLVELEESTAALGVVQGELDVMKDEVLDRDAIIATQQETEESLSKEAAALVETVQQAGTDIVGLHRKIDAHASLAATAQEFVSVHTEAISGALGDMHQQVEALHTTQMSKRATLASSVQEHTASQTEGLEEIAKAGTALNMLAAALVAEVKDTAMNQLQAQEEFSTMVVGSERTHVQQTASRISGIQQQLGLVLDGLRRTLGDQQQSIQAWKEQFDQQLSEATQEAETHLAGHVRALEQISTATGAMAVDHHNHVQEQILAMAAVQQQQESLLAASRKAAMQQMEALLEQQAQQAKQQLAERLGAITGAMQTSAAGMDLFVNTNAAAITSAAEAVHSRHTQLTARTESLRTAAETVRLAGEVNTKENQASIDGIVEETSTSLRTEAGLQEEHLACAVEQEAAHRATQAQQVQTTIIEKLSQLQAKTNTDITTGICQPAAEMVTSATGAAAMWAEELASMDEEATASVAEQKDSISSTHGTVGRMVSDVLKCTYQEGGETPKKSKQYAFPAFLPSTADHAVIAQKRRNGTLDTLAKINVITSYTTSVESLENPVTEAESEELETEEKSVEMAEASPVVEKRVTAVRASTRKSPSPKAVAARKKRATMATSRLKAPSKVSVRRSASKSSVENSDNTSLPRKRPAASAAGGAPKRRRVRRELTDVRSSKV